MVSRALISFFVAEIFSAIFNMSDEFSQVIVTRPTQLLALKNVSKMTNEWSTWRPI